MKHKYLERSLNIWKKVWNLILQFVTSLQAQSSERTSHWKYREKFPCANWLGFSHNPGNIIGNNFVMGQKSVGHLVWSVEVEVRSLVPAFNRRKNKEKGDLCKGFSLSNLTRCLHWMRRSLFDIHRSNEVTYRFFTHYKVVSYDIAYIVWKFQSIRRGEFFPILQRWCPFLKKILGNWIFLTSSTCRMGSAAFSDKASLAWI
jgi:hypothetical protein